MKSRFLIASVFALIIAYVALPVQAQHQDGPVFTLTNAPAAAGQATATKAAATGVRYVADCLVAAYTGNASLAAVATANVLIRDGATGVGTIIYQASMTVAAAPGPAAPLVICPSNGMAISGTAGNAMTVEFSAGSTNVLESVYLRGHAERP